VQTAGTSKRSLAMMQLDTQGISWTNF